MWLDPIVWRQTFVFSRGLALCLQPWMRTGIFQAQSVLRVKQMQPYSSTTSHRSNRAASNKVTDGDCSCQNCVLRFLGKEKVGNIHLLNWWYGNLWRWWLFALGWREMECFLPMLCGAYTTKTSSQAPFPPLACWAFISPDITQM